MSRLIAAISISLDGYVAGPELIAALRGRVGATIMGRGMYSGGAGAWEEDPRPAGWWGEDPPFHQPVFVLTSHAREPLPMQGGTTYTFVTDGIASALEQARAAAGGSSTAVRGVAGRRRALRVRPARGRVRR